MNNEDIKVGNKYRIKSWEDMEDTLNVGHLEGSITFDGYDIMFLKSMKHICGDIVTIKNQWKVTDVWEVEENTFIFAAPMLEELSKEELDEYNKPDLLTTPTTSKQYIVTYGHTCQWAGTIMTEEQVTAWITENGYKDTKIFEVAKQVSPTIELN